MPSLTDNKKKDTFVVGISDAQVKTQLELTCSAGRTDLLILRQDKACAVAGNGAIINPSNQQALPRTQYAGGYTVKSDGSTDATGLTPNYLALGKVAPSTAAFTGSLNLRPENTSSGAAGLRDLVMKQLNTNSGGAVIDDRIDSVDLNSLFIPSAGLPSDPGCTWNGNMIFAYQTDSWFMDLKASCGGKEYALKGNMPWTDLPGVENQTQYDLTLTLPSETVIGDDALFASVDANADLFSTADGVSAQIIMKEFAPRDHQGRWRRHPDPVAGRRVRHVHRHQCPCGSGALAGYAVRPAVVEPVRRLSAKPSDCFGAAFGPPFSFAARRSAPRASLPRTARSRGPSPGRWWRHRLVRAHHGRC